MKNEVKEYQLWAKPTINTKLHCIKTLADVKDAWSAARLDGNIGDTMDTTLTAQKFDKYGNDFKVMITISKTVRKGLIADESYRISATRTEV